MSDILVQKKVSLLSKLTWWCRECTAALLWLAAFSKTFVFDFDVYLIRRFAPTESWILEYKFFTLLAIAAGLCILAGVSRFRVHCLYIIFYPFVISLWRLPVAIATNWTTTLAFAPAIYSLITTCRQKIIWFALVMLSALVILASDNLQFICVSMTILAVFLCRHFYFDFRRAFSPSTVFIDLASVVRRAGEFFQEKVIAEQARKLATIDPDTEQFRNDFKGNLIIAYVGNSALQSVAYKLKDVADSGKLNLYFIGTLLFTFFITTLVFTFEYLALFKIDNSSFRSDVASLGLLEFLGFSFNMMATASVSKVSANSGLAQLLCYLQLLALVVFGVVTVSVVFTIARDKCCADMQRVIDELNSRAVSIAGQMENGFKLTYDELENYLLVKSSVQLVNFCRRMRGAKELNAPVSDIVESTQSTKQAA